MFLSLETNLQCPRMARRASQMARIMRPKRQMARMHDLILTRQPLGLQRQGRGHCLSCPEEQWLLDLNHLHLSPMGMQNRRECRQGRNRDMETVKGTFRHRRQAIILERIIQLRHRHQDRMPAYRPTNLPMGIMQTNLRTI